NTPRTGQTANRVMQGAGAMRAAIDEEAILDSDPIGARLAQLEVPRVSDRLRLAILGDRGVGAMDTTNSLGLKRRGRTLRPKRLVASLMASLLLLFLCNCVAAYYAPRYGEAVAETPVIGAVSSKLLQFYGVREGNVTVVNDAATSSGHTVRLVAAYADALRTVFYIEIDGKGLAGDPNVYGRRPGEFGVRYDTPTLVDQFGHNYELRGPGGANELGFEPLAWPASKVGARLTLHVDGLVELWLPPGTEGLVSGSWTLHAT